MRYLLFLKPAPFKVRVKTFRQTCSEGYRSSPLFLTSLFCSCTPWSCNILCILKKKKAVGVFFGVRIDPFLNQLGGLLTSLPISCSLRQPFCIKKKKMLRAAPLQPLTHTYTHASYADPQNRAGMMTDAAPRNSPMTYVSSRARVSVRSDADRAVHFQLQQRWGLLKVNSGLVTLLRGRGRGGGEYTVPDVRG